MIRHYDDMLDLTLDTVIVDEKKGYYAFEDTVFYGEKGGMLADTGTINGFPVTDLKWEGDTLYHQVNDGKTELSHPIHLEVDRHTRVVNTTIQSALHLLDGFYEKLNLRIHAVGVSPENQWYEVNTKDLDSKHFAQVQSYMEQAILDDVPSSFEYFKGSEYPDDFYAQFDEVRVVSFDGLDRQPCGTPHVNSTGQIGSFAILGSEHTSRGTRVYITAGPTTAQTLIEKKNNIEEIRQLLNTNEEQLVAKVRDLLKENKTVKKEVKTLRQELLGYKAKELLKRKEQLLLNEVTTSDLRPTAQLLSKDLKETKVLLVNEDQVTNFAIVSPDKKAREILASVQKTLKVNGGGSPQIVSGRTEVPIETLIDCFKQSLME